MNTEASTRVPATVGDETLVPQLSPALGRRRLLTKGLAGLMAGGALVASKKATATTWSETRATTVDSWAHLDAALGDPTVDHIFIKGTITAPANVELQVTRAGVVIEGLGQSKLIPAIGMRAIIVRANAVELRNLTINCRGQSSGLVVENDRTDTLIENCHIFGAAFTHSETFGAIMIGLRAAGTRILNNVITDTAFMHAIAVIGENSEYNSQGVVISNNIIDGVVRRVGWGNGIYVNHYSGVICCQNHVRNVGRNGVEFFYTHRVLCEGNVIEDCDQSVQTIAISMGYSFDSLVIGNRVSRAGFIGIELIGIELLCEGNLVEDIQQFKGDGLVFGTTAISVDGNGVAGGTKATVIGNLVRYPYGFGLQAVNGTRDIIVHDNEFLMMEPPEGGSYSRAIMLNGSSTVRGSVKSNVIRGKCDGAIYIFGATKCVAHENVQYSAAFSGEIASSNNMITLNGGDVYQDYTGTVYTTPGWVPNGNNLRVFI